MVWFQSCSLTIRLYCLSFHTSFLVPDGMGYLFFQP